MKEDELIAEWGCDSPVRFLPSECVTMSDSLGNPVLCACGKPAGCGVIGKEARQMWCTDCSPLNNYEAEMVYRPLPKNYEWEILNPEWTVNFKAMKDSECKPT